MPLSRFALSVALFVLIASACQKLPRDEHTRPFSAGRPEAGSSAGPGDPEAGSSGADNEAGRSGSSGGAAGSTPAGGSGGEPASAGHGSSAGVDGGMGGDSGSHGDDTDPPWATPDFTKRGLLEHSATCARLQLEAFLPLAEALEDAATTHSAQRSAASLDAARTAFKAAYLAWQRAEAFRVGPASADVAAGGQSLRDQIYPYPLINRCAIDANTVSKSYASGSIDSLSTSQRGLGAIEYLLFQSDTSNACASASPINDGGQWAQLGASEVAARRADYATRAAHDVVLRARALVEAWGPDGGDFYTQLVSAGDGSAVFKTEHAALNALNEALYYIEIEVKDFKIGQPAGVSTPCGASCGNLVEARFSRSSIEALRANVEGVRKLFEGCGPSYSGLGFDDFLIEVEGDDALARSMIDGLARVQSALLAIDSLEDAVAARPSEVQSLYATVKAFTDQLKSDFITVLNLSPPPLAGGDND